MQNSREGESPAAELALENKPITEYMVGPAPLEGTNFDEDWACYRDDDVIRQQDAIQAVEAEKIPLVGDKEHILALAEEFQSGSPVIQSKIKLLPEKYSNLRRTRGDGNCFFRGFMFSYLEHILDSQDGSEVDRIQSSIVQCKKALQDLGYAEFTFEDFFMLFIEQLQCVLNGHGDSYGHDELLKRSQDPSVSNYVVMFLRFVTTGEIRRRSDFYEPFILGISDSSVDQFCKTAVEPMGAESDQVQIIALSDALGVPIRVVYLDGSTTSLEVNHHDFIPTLQDEKTQSNEGSESKINQSPEPFVTLLYRPGHYDILYAK